MTKRHNYLQNKTCKTCGKPISDKNKSGFCVHHLPRDGIHNPMYGKNIKDYMTPEKYLERKTNLSISLKKCWKNPEYRKKVIENATGVKRPQEFRDAQSKRTKQSYVNNPKLREIRGKLFAQCWKDGRNKVHPMKSVNHSKGELSLFSAIKNLGKYLVERKSIKTPKGKIYYPDILINNKVIVEYYGDYFHANPKMYSDDNFILKKNMSAKEVWTVDKRRQRALMRMGYKFIVIWQHDWDKNQEITLKKLDKRISKYLESN